MKLYNTLTKQIDEVKPLTDNTIRIYSCGPTVYNHAHIGNLSAYIFADTLRRTIKLAGYDVLHAMNYTDVDDKTIRRSHEKYPDEEPGVALRHLTDDYIRLFLEDMEKLGNDTDALTFVRATDEKIIEGMRQLIAKLHKGGFAYIVDDGVYFSIEAYRKSGKKYGQLLDLTLENTSEARIQNDEYDKESVHDFALWKKQKEGEPAWEFTLDGQDLNGRPGWHIECSVMSRQLLGQPFDIHTGGVDLIFPHHENEIAQSTAGENNPLMSRFFAHNEHILVDGKKMSKSAHNFYTLQDVLDRGYDPLAFRLLVLQAHYRSQAHFTWENLEAAQNRLKDLRALAVLRFQPVRQSPSGAVWDFSAQIRNIKAAMELDLRTPNVLGMDFAAAGAVNTIGTGIANAQTQIDLMGGIPESKISIFTEYIQTLDAYLGLKLIETADIEDVQKRIIVEREEARQAKDWAKSDELRDRLTEQGIGVRDTEHGTIWFRL